MIAHMMKCLMWLNIMFPFEEKETNAIVSGNYKYESTTEEEKNGYTPEGSIEKTVLD